MRMYGKLLALCVIDAAVWGAKGFMSEAPMALKTNAQSSHRSLQTFSFFDSRSGDTRVSEQAPPTSIGTPNQGASLSTSRRPVGMEVSDVWDTSAPVTVQGDSLRTWSFASASVERVQVLMRTEGRPLNADVELWQGPDNTPQSMKVYVEDGSMRTFSVVIETPRGSNAIAIRNTNTLEYPLAACVEADTGAGGLGDLIRDLAERRLGSRTVQGGAVFTAPFAPAVESVQVMLRTDGRPLNARIELLQGPNNIKEVIDLYTEDGLERPFFAVFETPGTGNVVRIVNTATMEFPLTAIVEPYQVAPGFDNGALSGDTMGGGRRSFY